MFKSIDPRSPTPLYAQIADRIRLAVAAGELVKGESLPSVRALATQLRVNPATIVQAYRELERDREGKVAELDPAAARFWEAATKSYRTGCVWWVISAKQAATRERRFEQLLECCAAYELIPAQRYGTPPAWLRKLRAERGGDDA